MVLAELMVLHNMTGGPWLHSHSGTDLPNPTLLEVEVAGAIGGKMLSPMLLSDNSKEHDWKVQT